MLSQKVIKSYQPTTEFTRSLREKCSHCKSKTEFGSYREDKDRGVNVLTLVCPVCRQDTEIVTGHFIHRRGA
jgi:hypothetical protein